MRDDDDPYRWLEDVEGGLPWVRERNAEVVPPAPALVAEIREVLDAAGRIPWPDWHGEHFYNLWQDAEHVRGLWRRTTSDGYARPDPPWEVLLDLDALGGREGESWVWAGATFLRPEHRRCLVALSRGGSDARVVREYDLEARDFVPGGFALPEAKTEVAWIDADTVYVCTEAGPGSLTTSGYPRTVRRWRRGEPFADAPVVFECAPDDVGVFAFHDRTPGFERGFVGRYLDIFRRECFHVRPDGSRRRLDIPEDTRWSTHREWLLVRPRTQWTVAGVTHPAGSLLVAPFDEPHDVTVLFTPDDRTALTDFRWTRDHLVITTLTDVRAGLAVLTPGSWERTSVATEDHAVVVDTEPDASDEVLLASTGFLRPDTLTLGARELKRAPSFFDPDGMTVEQRFAVSDDGTRVPYFLVGGPNATGPTWLNGYGGFEVSRTPAYDGVVGRTWLARGGRYAVANIRGGGEYGPRWHLAAQRERRPRAFEDFAAVARDLVATGVTTPARLGITGGSNGGLLMGVMLTRYPELFGAVVASVPLLDMRRYHRLPAGASWIGEYGDPDDPADWAHLARYSPYHHVEPGRPYPPVLFVTSTRDDRVHPGHARKMVARLRSLGYRAELYENVEGGHGAAADNAQLAYVDALKVDFLWRHLAATV